MANIILPQVDILSTVNSNTNIIVEQNEQIYRVNASLIEGSTDAETLGGHSASYFAPLTSLNTTNTNISNLSNRVTTIEGNYVKSSDIVDYSDDITGLATRISNLESAEVPSGMTRTLLWSAPSSYDDNGIGQVELTLNDNLSNYDALEFTGIWTYINEDYDWMYTPNETFIIDRSESSSNGGISYVITGFTHMRVFVLASDYNNSIYLQQGLNTDGISSNYYCVPSAIYGIKYN